MNFLVIGISIWIGYWLRAVIESRKRLKEAGK